MVAAKIANLRDGETKAGAQISAPVSQQDAAKLLQVSRGSVQNAAVVRREGVPELVEAVEKGEVAVPPRGPQQCPCTRVPAGPCRSTSEGEGAIRRPAGAREPLSNPTTAVRPRSPEPLFLPQSRPLPPCRSTGGDSNLRPAIGIVPAES
jgi:hypothetical protein